MKGILFTLLVASALTTAHADDLVINELMASNAGVVMSPATKQPSTWRVCTSAMMAAI